MAKYQGDGQHQAEQTKKGVEGSEQRTYSSGIGEPMDLSRAKGQSMRAESKAERRGCKVNKCKAMKKRIDYLAPKHKLGL